MQKVLVGGLAAVAAAIALGLSMPATPALAATCDDYSNQADAQRAQDTRDADGDGLLDEDGTDGAPVSIRTDPSQDRRDRYRRLLAYVNASHSGIDVAKRQVRAGWAKVYVFEKRFRRYGSFMRASKSARHAGRGAWSQCGGNFHRSA